MDTGEIVSTHSPDAPEADGLTARADAVPRRSPDKLRLGDCWRLFIRQPSPPLLGIAVLAAAVLRGLLGSFSWRDLVMIAALVAVTPVIEWLIHVYLLHAKPLHVGGRTIDLVAARQHRAHHSAPTMLKEVLLPRHAVGLFAVQIALIVWAVSFPLRALLGGHRLAWAATGVLAGCTILAAYEWCHFLIHAPYRPRGRYYRSIWRGHRLHHYKNEHYWFGVTSTVGDRLLHTAPEHSQIPKSPTARALRSNAP